MRGIILALILVVVGCQQAKYELKFPGKKTYHYKYEGMGMIGISENGLVRAGVKLSSGVDITQVSENIYLLHLMNPLIQEYNGFWPKAPFIPMAKLNQALEPQLTQPLRFEYDNGKVGQIFTPASVSNTVVNIHRGILSMLQLTLKNTHTVYQLQEPDIAGTCHTNYVLQQENGSNRIFITKSKDLTNCKEEVQRVTGMAYLQRPTSTTEVAKNILGTVVYEYDLKLLKNIPGLLITDVTSKAVYQFSPFIDESEASLSEASQKLTLVQVKESHGSYPDLEFQKRGPIQYQFASEIHKISALPFRVENLEAEVIHIIQQLVLKNTERVQEDAPNQFFTLIQLLRRCSFEDINGVWKHFANSQQYRSWFLHAVPVIGNLASFRFIAATIKKSELTISEAGQVLVLSMHFVQANQDIMRAAADLIFTRNNFKSPFLPNVAVLAYGSLVNKFCVMNKDCPNAILKPLHDYAESALTTAKEEDLVLALKALGNTGHSASIKPIMKILPGLSSVAPEFLAKVQVDAVMALRNIAKNDPTRVQEISLGIFMDKNQKPEIRILASVVLLEAKPSLALLATVAEALSEETNLQISSFLYSLMKSMSRSMAPGQKRLSAACNAVVKLLSPKFDQLSYRYSKAVHINLYKYNMVSGAAVTIYLMNNAASLIPKFFIFKVHAYLLDKAFEPLEIGIRAEGLEETFVKNNDESQTTTASMSIQNILMLISRWKYVPSIKTLASVYIKIFGQEIFYGRMDKKSIEEMFQVVREPVSEHTMVWRILAMLQEGKTLQLSKALLVAELRGIFPTSIGLPLEMSLVSTAVATALVTAQVKILPAPTGESSLAQLLNSEIQISADASTSMAVTSKSTVGINTEIIQAGRELDLMAHITIPVKFTVKIDAKERNLKLQYDPCLRETDLLTVRTNSFSVTRNKEDPTADKKIQLQPEYLENNTVKSHFKPEALHSDGKDLVFSDEIMSTKTETVDSSLHSSAGQNSICAEAQAFGFKVCLETQSQSDAKLVDVLLCKQTGFNFLTISLKPVPNPAVDNVEIEIQTGPKSAAKIIQMTSIAQQPAITQMRGRVLRQLKGILTYDKNLGDSFPPLFAIVIHTRASDGNLQGYELAVYADTMSPQPRVQMLAMELGSMENWKVCVDAELQNDHRALMVMQWGKECQVYKMTVEEVTGRLATHPALKIKAKWDRIPPTMKYAGKMLGKSLPWTAEILGFTEKWQTNPSKQLSLYLAAPSPRSLDVILKTPEMTFFKLNVPLPFAIPTGGIPKPSSLATHFSKTLTELAELSTSECTAEGEKFTTFDGVHYIYSMPRGCFHMLALDCVFSPRFMVLLKLASVSDRLQMVKVHITDSVIEMLPSVTGELKLIYNNHEIPSINLPFPDANGKVMVQREGQGLVLSAEQYGLDRLYFSGGRTELRTGAIMRGRMCGLCGHNDGETNLVFHMPDGKMARSAISFAHSWILMHESCREECKLQQDHMDLGQSLSIFGEPTHCYSAEPVLRCAPGCSPIHTALLNISFYCHATDNPLEMDDYASPVGKKAAKMVSVISHTECSCPTVQCSEFSTVQSE